MSLFSLEHGKLAYWSDFAFYGVVVSLFSGWVVLASPGGHGVFTQAEDHVHSIKAVLVETLA